MDPEMSISRRTDAQSDEEDIDSEDVSQAGDDGASVIDSRRHNRSFRFSVDVATKSGDVGPISGDLFSQSCNVKKQEEMKQFLAWLEFASCVIHLSVFGILGVITRYYLEKLFGPKVIGWMSDGSVWYLDLPSNVIGSFLMGWLGVVFKTNIASVSDPLAIGLTTGYLGSLTTFSGWNQKMLELSVEGRWGLTALGISLGLGLATLSIFLGAITAQGTKWLFQRLRKSSSSGTNFRVETLSCHIAIDTFLVAMWGALWALSAAMETREFRNGGSGDAQLWLGCIVGPFGVWARWWLARLNGRRLGKTGRWKRLPFGTLIANVSAACIMAALATVKKSVNTETSVTVASGVQLGFLGCLSTVSTMMAELYSMIGKGHFRLAFVYTFITIGVSFGLGTLIYSVPVWVKGYV